MRSIIASPMRACVSSVDWLFFTITRGTWVNKSYKNRKGSALNAVATALSRARRETRTASLTATRPTLCAYLSPRGGG
jgi:hypothetical protein